MKKNILTEQGNPAIRRIDLMETGEIVAAINHEDMKVARAVKRRCRKLPGQLTSSPEPFSKADGWHISAPEPAAGSAFWTRPNVCRHFPFRTQWYRRLSPEETLLCAAP